MSRLRFLALLVLCVLIGAACGTTEDPDPVDPEPPGPGNYPGDTETRSTCSEVCEEKSLVCNSSHRWSAFIGPGAIGAGRTGYSATTCDPDDEGCTEGSSNTRTFGCSEQPPETFRSKALDANGDPLETVYGLDDYICVCMNDPGGILYDIEQEIPAGDVYQGAFSLADDATVTYQIDDHYRLTANKWTIAMVPTTSVDAYLAGEEATVYGAVGSLPPGESAVGAATATEAVPAGEYTLVLVCRNTSDPCRFTSLVLVED